jgi:hypothetical protein
MWPETPSSPWVISQMYLFDFGRFTEPPTHYVDISDVLQQKTNAFLVSHQRDAGKDFAGTEFVQFCSTHRSLKLHCLFRFASQAHHTQVSDPTVVLPFLTNLAGMTANSSAIAPTGVLEVEALIAFF